MKIMPVCGTCTGSSSPPLCGSESEPEQEGTMPGKSRPPDLIILLIMALFLSCSMGYHSEKYKNGHRTHTHTVVGNTGEILIPFISL